MFTLVAAVVVLLGSAVGVGAVGEGAPERGTGPLVHKPHVPVATPGADAVERLGGDGVPLTPSSAADRSAAPVPPGAPDHAAMADSNADDEPPAPEAEPGGLPADRVDSGGTMPECRVREPCQATDPDASAASAAAPHTQSRTQTPTQTQEGQRLALPNHDGAEALTVGAGVGVGVVAALLYFLRAASTAGVVRLWAALAVRREPSELDAHPVRSSILRHVEAHPGATTRELAQVACVPYRRVVYHLGMLERAKRVRVRTVGRKRLHFPMNTPRVDEADLGVRALVDPCTSSGRILAHVAARPGPSLSRIARLFGLSPGNAHYHVQRLRDARLVHAVRHGPCIRHYVTERGRQWLQRVTPDAEAASPAAAVRAPGGAPGGVAA